jgi:transposase
MLPMELPGCHILAVRPAENHVVVVVEGEAGRQPCPDCGHESDDVHSRYPRKPRDLPVQGRRVRLWIIARRWRCLNHDCPRRTFNESFKGLVERHAQRTERMTELMRHLIVSVSSTVGAQLAQVMGMEVSGRTLLRVVGHEEVHVPPIRVLGLDDFALRKGRTYGTILCDLERGKPVDILIGRTKQDVLGWLKNHPGIEIAARDRASSYADALSTALPEAIQVADRFHLVKNLGNALKEVVDRQSWALPEPAPLPVSACEPEPAPESDLTPASSPAKRITRAEEKRTAAAERLERRYVEVQRLRASGVTVRQIRKATGLSRQTIRKYLDSAGVPKRAERRRAPSIVDSFADYLEERWQSGCHSAQALLAEIRQQGYTGSYSNLRRFLAPWRAELPRRPLKGRVLGRRKEDGHTSKVTWKEMRWAVLCPPEHLNAEQRHLLQGFLPLHPQLTRARDLVDRFRTMLKEHDTAAFPAWLKDAAESDLAPFERLARSLDSDRSAVLAGVALPWSTGPVEGQITRVKLLKRIGYGRAGLALLRARILGCA